VVVTVGFDHHDASHPFPIDLRAHSAPERHVEVCMKILAAPEDGSVNERFLTIWLHDPELLHLEFGEIADPLLP
jgi:hypothetical protein